MDVDKWDYLLRSNYHYHSEIDIDKWDYLLGRIYQH